MERLPVFKALGDNTRYAIFLELARSATPLSTAEIAEALDLHPNTVRPHLERMRDAGLLSVDTDRQGQVGRPQHVYSVSPDAPSLGLEPSAFRLLARLVADTASRAGLDSDEVAAVGREHGAAMAAGLTSPVVAVRDCLAELGFDPAVATDGSTTTVAFTRCPFQELAEEFPDVVCHLHRGIVEGIVATTGRCRVSRFSTLEDRDPCEVDLVRS
ncbi:MAG: helix-turn-helix transcriptional regulator [Acidimicrobiales bacterium]